MRNERPQFTEDFQNDEMMTDRLERSVLVMMFDNERDEQKKKQIDELSALVESSGGEIVGIFQQAGLRPNPRTLIGSGKVTEIAEFVEFQEIDLVVFNDELTGSQMKNLSDAIDCKVIDRVDLLLDIFAMRARTKKSTLQVRLAQLEYRLPRLKGYGTALSREGGGIGTRGPGEQKLETDRRAIEREIDSIKRQLAKISDQEDVVAKRRRGSSIPIVSLVGYTNVGKSTLMNALMRLYGSSTDSNKAVYADDRFFATLDISSRRIEPEGERPYLLADTIGFIQDMPEKLEVSFASTLEEIRYSDLILLVIDSSNEAYEDQIKVIQAAIKEVAGGTPIIYVMNKSDLVEAPLVTPKEETMRVSARDDESVARLNEKIVSQLGGEKVVVEIRFPYDKLGILSAYQDQGMVQEVEHKEDGVYANMALRQDDLESLKRELGSDAVRSLT